MKHIRLVLLAVFMIFAGCLAQEHTVPPTPNQSPSQETVLPADESVPEPEISANLTIAVSDEMQTPGNEANQTGTPGGNESSPGDNETQNHESESAKAPEGLVFGNGSYALAFDDASVIPASSEPCGIFSLWLANGTLLEKMFICPGESEIWRSPGGGEFRIKVIQVAAGYSGSAAWANVIIYGEDPAPDGPGGRQNATVSDESRKRQACCGECIAAYSQSPIAVGPNGARCGHFMTGNPLSAECAGYFEEFPSTVSGCG